MERHRQEEFRIPLRSLKAMPLKGREQVSLFEQGIGPRVALKTFLETEE